MHNLIHSLDAASLSLLIYKYFNEYKNDTKNIFAIHDCFATTCNNMHFVIDSLKEIYILIYCDKIYLKELDENMKKHIHSTIDENFSIKKSLNKKNTFIIKYLTGIINCFYQKKKSYIIIYRILKNNNIIYCTTLMRGVTSYCSLSKL